MIGIVVVSHGKLARELVAAAEHVVGPQENFEAISIEADDDMEARREQIIETALACDQGKGVIILTDMFGGTPSNLAISILDKGPVEVIAGINLPMLIKLAGLRTSTLLVMRPSMSSLAVTPRSQPYFRGVLGSHFA